MKRIIGDVVVERFHSSNHDQLGRHLQGVIDADKFGRRLKARGSLAPCAFICE